MSSEKNNHPSSTQDALPIYRHQGRALGVSFQDVSVIGSVDSRNTALDLLEIFHRAVLAPLTIARRLVGNRRVPAKRILRDVSGVVFPGETMLVLGRPCSGCSTTLKVIGNSRESFANVQGEVRYATIGASDMAQRFSSEVVYCGEDDMHFPRLSVGHTTKFGLHLRGGGGGDASNDFVDNMADRLLHSLDIPHTKDTIVGDSFVRGVSGGERRRVSLLESLASNPAVGCWDNPIRGLDSSAALKFLRTLKKISQATGMANIVTLYQTSETMYTECFDRVMVLYEGRMIFCGKATEAKQYFVDLGFFCHSRQTTPEFLTAVASPAERVVRDDHHSPVSLDPDALAQTFRKSRHYEQLKADMEAYDFRFKSDPSPVNEFITEHSRLRSRWAIPRAPHPGSIVRQTLRATWRHFILLWNDRRSYFTAVLMTIITAVLNGSAFFHAPKTSTGSFMKGGGVFFTLIYFFLNALNQLSSTVTARPVLAKQHRLGFLHPVSYILAQTLADVPTAFLESMVFSAPYYFLLGLTPTASHFFTFYLIVSLFYCASLSLFRMLGAWSPNNNLAMLMGGAALPVSLAYSGYAPPVPTMLGWGSWIRRVSPSPWALEALMGNEFAGIDLRCTDSQMVPSGPGYGDQTYQGCPLPGAGKGRSIIPGEEYLEQYYGWYRANLWRNVGIIVAMWAIYVTLATIGLSVMIKTVGAEGGIVYKRGARRLDEVQTPYMGDKVPDVEKQAEEPASQTPSIGSASSKHSPDGSECDKHESSDDDQPEAQRKATASTFTFEDVVYTINANGEEKRLLHNVSGYVKPGQLTALMGASGAGKTTLLDTLSQRKSEGRVEGTVLLNGKPLDAAFGRACGFCMQQDVHEPNATVREALQFSALMRQPKSVPDAEKLAHVEEIISLLELAPIADAIIGKPGIGGLGVEERKRVTIGVELAAKPSALLFLDEPTSGLDSQAAFSIVRFLQRIAAQGIPVVCTIHQPSGIIFDKFDHVLLLAPGGKTLYFGETGHNCRRVVDYFARYGAVMNETENPAEFIINTATSKEDPPKDWARIWTESPENQQVRAKISELKITAAAATEQDSSSAAPIQAFALPLQDQIIKLTTRHWISVWRDGFYNFSKLYKVLFTETFLAFNFFQADASLQGTQNRMLFFLLASWLVPTIVPDIQAVWYSKWALYTAREKNGIYSQHALVASLVLVELPWQALGSALAFLCSYWTIGYPPTATQTGYSLLLFCLLGVFGTGFAQTLAALCPSESVVAYANSLVWVVLTAFTGAAIPHTLMNAFYKPWLFWADPLRYFVGGAAENVMHGVSVVCAAHDLTVFDPPPGQTCGAYMTDYLAIGSGYLVDVDATSDCEYCSYADGDEYAASLDFWYGRRWRDFGIFLAFCVSNVVLAFLVPWVRRWWVRRK